MTHRYHFGFYNIVKIIRFNLYGYLKFIKLDCIAHTLYKTNK